MKKRLILLFIGLFLIFQLGGCAANTIQTTSSSSSEQTENESGGKIQLVFEYQDGRVSKNFEEKLESLFPVDIVMDCVTSTIPHLRLHEELTHDMAPDFVLCEFIRRFDDEFLAQYFYDMGAESFVNNYYLSALESCTSADGGLYYLPGPSYVYGIAYDKTAFRELGLSVPKNYSEFVKLIKDVEAMGLKGTKPDPHDPEKTIEVPVRAFVPTMRWCDMSAIMFNTINYADCFRGISNGVWLDDYQKGEESMVGHLEGAAEKYLKLFEDGILTTDLWEMQPGNRSRMLYEYHTSLMTIESQQAFQINADYTRDKPEIAHEIGLMPIFTSDNPNSDYLYAIPRSFVSITAQGAKNSEKLEMMLKIMEYLSTTEGQMLLMDGSDYFGFLKNDTSLTSDYYADVMDTIKEGRVITNFFFEGAKNGDAVETYMHDATPALVNGEITINEWLKTADEYRDKAISPKPQNNYGTIAENLEPIQAAYVDGLAYLSSMDADLAYVPIASAFGTRSCYYSGTVNDDTIKLISTENAFHVTNLEENELTYVVAEMTGRELMDRIVEVCDNAMAGLAGAEVIYSRSGEGAAHYVSIKINGEELDMNKTYRVAALWGAVPKSKIVEEHPELKFKDMFIKYLSDIGGTITAPKELSIVD